MDDEIYKEFDEIPKPKAPEIQDIKEYQKSEEEDDSSDLLYISPEEILGELHEYENQNENHKLDILNDLSLSLKDSTEEESFIFTDENIPGFLIFNLLNHQTNYMIFTKLIDCVFSWLQNPFTKCHLFYDFDFINLLFYSATQKSIDTSLEDSNEHFKFEILPNERKSLISIFIYLIQKNPVLVHSMISQEDFYNRIFKSYQREIDQETKIKFLYSADLFLKAENETIEESEEELLEFNLNTYFPVIRLSLLIQTQEKLEFITIDEYDLLCSIFETLFSLNNSLAAVLIENFNAITAIRNCRFQNSDMKTRLCKLLLNCFLKDTGDISQCFFKVIDKFNWHEIILFLDQETDSVICNATKFLTLLIAKQRDILDLPMANTFLNMILSMMSEIDHKYNVAIVQFLTTIINIDHEEATNYLIENHFITHIGPYLQMNDDDFVFNILETISFLCDKYSKTNEQMLSFVLREINDENIIDILQELTEEENESIASLSNEFLNQFFPSE